MANEQEERIHVSVDQTCLLLYRMCSVASANVI
jgi:hypothetical protein